MSLSGERMCVAKVGMRFCGSNELGLLCPELGLTPRHDLSILRYIGAQLRYADLVLGLPAESCGL